MKKTRNKGWRKEVAKTKKARKRSDKKIKSDFIEKNWKFLYLRSEKLKRAKQLGIEYPKKSPYTNYINEELQSENVEIDIFTEVSKILRYKWNPIEVSDELPDDGYDSYVPRILKLIHNHACKELLATTLQEIALNSLGIDMNESECLNTASLLLKIPV